jgi:hypothetical protein
MSGLFWSFAHNVIAHPMMFFTFNSNISIKFHDWTAEKMHIKYPKPHVKADDNNA